MTGALELDAYTALKLGSGSVMQDRTISSTLSALKTL